MDTKLHEIIQRLEHIERIVDPPVWKKILKWVLNHLLGLIVLVFISYLVWEIWQIVNTILQEWSEFKAGFLDSGEALLDSGESILDTVKNFIF